VYPDQESQHRTKPVTGNRQQEKGHINMAESVKIPCSLTGIPGGEQADRCLIIDTTSYRFIG
jgi:hypothetical protein